MSTVGIDLTSLTVLIGALGVGICSGLQDIINNFVSGLVILFERPIQIGHRVEVRLHPTTLELRYAGQLVEIFPRLRGDKSHRIDYRHVIASLVRKPGAFANYRFREELYPTLTFRRAYDALVASRGDRADVDYVRILYLAAQTTESVVEAALARLLEAGERFDYATVEALARPREPECPVVRIPVPDLTRYDALIGGAA